GNPEASTPSLDGSTAIDTGSAGGSLIGTWAEAMGAAAAASAHAAARLASARRATVKLGDMERPPERTVAGVRRRGVGNVLEDGWLKLSRRAERGGQAGDGHMGWVTAPHQV